MLKTVFTTNNNDNFKMTDIGYFNPSLPKEMGDYYDIGKDIYWRNVHLFADAVRDKSDGREAKMATDLNRLFKGGAQTWWLGTLTDIKRTAFKIDLEMQLAALIKEFQP